MIESRSFSIYKIKGEVFMMGSTHKTVGLFTGIILALCGIIFGQELWVISLSTVPFGAMLPDIDHNNSQLGRIRKKAVNASKDAIILGTIAAMLACTIVVFTVSNMASLFKVLFIPSCILLLYCLSHSKLLRSKFKFFTKHRGIMHTLIMPTLFVLAGLTVESEAICYLLLGLAIGYVTHLLGDCMTKEGCPILYPITKKNIRFLKVTTNTPGEKIAAVVLCIGIAGLCFLYFKLVS